MLPCYIPSSINGVVVTWIVATQQAPISIRRGFDSLLMQSFFLCLFSFAYPSITR